MDTMETAMGTRTSPAARRALGMVKARGQNSMAQPLWIQMSTAAYQWVSGVKLYRPRISGRPSSSTALSPQVHR